MLWAVLALGVVQVGARAPALMRTSDLVMVVAELAVTCLVLGLVIFKISEGRNWARYALIALFFTGAMPSMGIHGPASSSAISTIAFVVALVLQVCAMVLLFLHQARQWFKAQAVAKPA